MTLGSELAALATCARHMQQTILLETLPHAVQTTATKTHSLLDMFLFVDSLWVTYVPLRCENKVGVFFAVCSAILLCVSLVRN